MPEDANFGFTSIAGREIHVWDVALDAAGVKAESMASYLAASELERAEGFRFARDRRRFVLSHGWLRLLLSAYTGVGPAKLAFTFGPEGKPSLADMGSVPEVHFNLSHAHERMLLAVTRGQRVGVDLEYVRPPADGAGVARAICSAREYAVLTRLAGEAWLNAFFTYWICKEAFVKACGVGLSYPMSKIELVLDPTPRLMLADDAPGVDRGWALTMLSLTSGYVGAVVAEGSIAQLTYRQASMAVLAERLGL
jgi:4'-phosphopantetheinyl transferase